MHAVQKLEAVQEEQVELQGWQVFEDESAKKGSMQARQTVAEN